MEGRRLTSEEYARLGRRALLELEWPPCRAACPVHADVRGYIELIARGRYGDALELIRERLPFPSVCGRICHHPCEEECRRKELDEPAAIRDLKRFVAEYDYPEPLKPKPPKQTREKVAVVGAGPAGLTAALDLAKAGYRPTVFEKHELAGGILATAVPTYRLPRSVLEKDIDAILAQGVELKTGVEVGKDVTLDDLRAQGFAAIVIAVGLARSRGLPIPGADAAGVHLALPFLEGFIFDRKPDMGEDAIVIGGGNVAIDCARSAVRGGAERVRMVCLENEEEQPAWDWESREAAEEEIETVYRLGPKRILLQDGRVAGVEFKRVTSVFDADGRFDPKYDETELTSMECDTVVFAIGQAADLSLVEGTDVGLDERGRLVYDRDRARTSAQDVFACGEVVTGPGAAVEAAASGHRAARAVEQFLRGEEIDLAETLPPEIERLPESAFDRVPRVARPEMPTVPPEERKRSFEEFELGLSEQAVLAAARSCMSCGAGAVVISDKCSACLTCLRVCPFDVPVVTEVAEMKSCLCQGCGICAAECPANAIVMAGYGLKDLAEETDRALASLAGDGARLVVYACGHHAPASLWGGGAPDRPAGAKEVYLPSMSRLNVADIAHAFESGADGVLVLACESGTCRYPQVDMRLRRRVAQARALLGEVGIQAERLDLREGVAGDAEATSVAIAEMAERLAEL
jgi:NADPH-dependent glutamate synthase beta subunit-like oxidoreductase/coenzyme F420-reducing hydrogenase delta subunit/Pyruvate/2-oxoacid:ferredoxin oxidoreductase delta subunit